MAVITMIKEIKRLYMNYVAIIKIGNFYHVYGKDSYILAYLFGYKLRNIEENCSTCGFPSTSLAKVKAKLEQKKINYIIIDRRNNYDVDEISDNKNLNIYQETFEKAKNYINVKTRVDAIYEKLLRSIKSKEITQEVKKDIYEMEKILRIQK